MNLEKIKKEIRIINDYPQKGIIFRDLTPVFQNSKSLQYLSDILYELYKDKNITKVVGIESRGFIMGPILATKINAGFVPIRKKGKLPGDVITEIYEKEYGEDSIEIHNDSLDKNDIVLIHDDILATGGTMKAAYNLVSKFAVKDIYLNFILELKELNGKEVLGKEVENKTKSLVKY